MTANNSSVDNQTDTNFVVAISGISGAGKTTLVQKVADVLMDAVTLHFDDYKSVAKYPQFPAEISQWIKDGRDLDAWKIPQLLEDLTTLRNGTAISLPNSNRKVGPAEVIVLEEPAGRARTGMQAVIDFLVFLDIPLEIALARKVVQDFNGCLADAAPDELASHVKRGVAYFADYPLAREYYLTLVERVRPDSDLILDGTRPTAELADEIVAVILPKLAGHNTSYSRVIGGLRQAYNQKVVERDQKPVDAWKAEERQHFLSVLRAENKANLLEIGTGTGVHGLFFHEHGLEVICTDLSPEMVALCRQKGLTAYVMDFLNLDFPPASFDAIFAMNCLLHVPRHELAKVLQLLQALLKPDGLFYLGQHGGIDREGIFAEDHYEPKRFFSRLSDEAIQQAVTEFFDILYFEPIIWDDQAPGHFQSMILRPHGKRETIL